VRPHSIASSARHADADGALLPDPVVGEQVSYSSIRRGKSVDQRPAAVVQPSGSSKGTPPIFMQFRVSRAPQYSSNRSRIASRSRKV
jgi:hypothetical protein